MLQYYQNSFMHAKNNAIEVIIPTYNAREGIINTILGIKSTVPEANIIIVDDNSPDKTARLVRSKFGQDRKISVIVRKKKDGRGSAVIKGFKEGLKNKKAKYFIEMDADLCHNPKYIPQLITECGKADVVILSKYLPRSTISGLTMRRKIMSRLMNFAAGIILQVPISDYSNGYRCYRRPVIAYIVNQKLLAKGFVVLSEIIYLTHKKGFKISEIPFNFKQQNISKSNMNFTEIKEAIWTLLNLRFSRL